MAINPNPSLLDSGQIIKRVHDATNDSIRVDIGSPSFNVDINASTGNDNIMAVGTTDGTTSGTQKVIKVAADGSIVVNTGTATARTITNKAITVGTTAVRCTVSGSAPSSTRVLLMLVPDALSLANFYVGSASVTSSGATRGLQIAGGQVLSFENDAGDYYICSDTATQTVYLMEQA